MKTVIIGTAGHIDHGKSELVHALTGTHPDRLREERERGITIDIGFASLALPDAVLSFVDVPLYHSDLLLAGPVPEQHHNRTSAGQASGPSASAPNTRRAASTREDTPSRSMARHTTWS